MWSSRKTKASGVTQHKGASISGEWSIVIENTSCAAEHSNNSSGQLREQELLYVIMWTGYYHSLVIGSQALHQSHKVSPQRGARWLFVCNRGGNGGSYSCVFYHLLKSDSLLVLSCGSCSGFLRPCCWDSLDLRQQTVLRLGETSCFGHVLPPPPVFSNLLAVFGRSFSWCVCLQALLIITSPSKVGW